MFLVRLRPWNTRGTLQRFGLGAAVLTCSAVSVVAIPGAAQAATPTIAVSPTTGTPGLGVTVTGSGWTPGDSVFVQIGSTAFDTDVVCVMTAASDGSVIGNQPQNGCRVPSVPVGARTLYAVDEQNQSTHVTGASFTVTPGLSLTPTGASVGTPASPGTTISVMGSGWTASSTVSGFKFDGAALTTTPASVTTDPSGNFTGAVTFTVPSTATVGSHTVTATDSASQSGSSALTVYRTTVSVSSSSGSPGTPLTVTGSGWVPGDSVFVQIGSTSFDVGVVCVLSVAADGSFIGNQPDGGCVVPAVPTGVQTLFAVDEQRFGVHGTGANFTVVPGLVFTPAGASAGTPASPGVTVSVVGKGWGQSAVVSGFKFDGTALATTPTSVSTDATGTFDAPVTFIVPATAKAGTHNVSASDGATTGTSKLVVDKPKIILSPTTGTPGSGLTVTGSGWPSGESVFIQVGSTAFDVDVACVLTAAADGSIAGNSANGCKVPAVPAGTETAFAIDAQHLGVQAKGAAFIVKPGMVLTPSGAAAGSPASPGATVSVQGTGWAPSSTVSGFKLDGHALTTVPSSISTDASGTFTGSLTFVVPAATAAGTHALTATDGSSDVGTASLVVYRTTVKASPTSGAPGAGVTITGSGWAPGDLVFVQIGSTTFDSDVACALTVAPDGTIAGNKTSGNCQVPSVATGSQPLFAIDEQQMGLIAHGTAFSVT